MKKPIVPLPWDGIGNPLVVLAGGLDIPGEVDNKAARIALRKKIWFGQKRRGAKEKK